MSRCPNCSFGWNLERRHFGRRRPLVPCFGPGPCRRHRRSRILNRTCLQNPEDLDARLELLAIVLRHCAASPGVDSGRRSVRLQHILYLVEHHPEAAVSASKAAYVYRRNGPYANAADHEAVRDQWLAAVQGHPKNNAVTMNAVKFLEGKTRTMPNECCGAPWMPIRRTGSLRRIWDSSMRWRFCGPDLARMLARSWNKAPTRLSWLRLEPRCRTWPCAQAAAASVDQKIFDLASELSARARQLAPDDRRYSRSNAVDQVFSPRHRRTLRGAVSSVDLRVLPSRIRVGENVQAANLIRKTQPQYPAAARKAGITVTCDCRRSSAATEPFKTSN